MKAGTTALKTAYKNAAKILHPITPDYIKQSAALFENPHKHDLPSGAGSSRTKNYVTMYDGNYFHPLEKTENSVSTEVEELLYKNDTDRFDVYQRWLKRVQKFEFTAVNLPRFLKVLDYSSALLFKKQQETLVPGLEEKIAAIKAEINTASIETEKITLMKDFVRGLMKKSGLVGRDLYKERPENIFVDEKWRLGYCRLLKAMGMALVEVKIEERSSLEKRYKLLNRIEMQLVLSLGQLKGVSVNTHPIIADELQEKELRSLGIDSKLLSNDLDISRLVTDYNLVKRAKGIVSTLGSNMRDHDSAPTDPSRDAKSTLNDDLGITTTFPDEMIENQLYGGLANNTHHRPQIKKCIAEFFNKIFWSHPFEIKEVKYIDKKQTPFHSYYYVRAIYDGLGFEIQIPTKEVLKRSKEGAASSKSYDIFKRVESQVREGGYVNKLFFEQGIQASVNLEITQIEIRKKYKLKPAQEISEAQLIEYTESLRENWIDRIELTYVPGREIFASLKELNRLFLEPIMVGRLPEVTPEFFKECLIHDIMGVVSREVAADKRFELLKSVRNEIMLLDFTASKVVESRICVKRMKDKLGKAA